MKTFKEGDFGEWYAANAFVPAHVGVYEFRPVPKQPLSVTNLFRYRDGQCWYRNAITPNTAFKLYKMGVVGYEAVVNQCEFRGLKEQYDPSR